MRSSEPRDPSRPAGPPASSPEPPGLPERLSHAVAVSDLGTLDRVLPTLFDELRSLARRKLAREHDAVTLQTTELVHEAYFRLVGTDDVTRKGRAYFFAAAGRAMRQVLVDAARRRNAGKRGSGAPVLPLDEAGGAAAFGREMLELDDALLRLETVHPRQAHVVECRFFGGMTVEDTAEALGVSPRTVKADWAFARAWLYEALEGAGP